MAMSSTKVVTFTFISSWSTLEQPSIISSRSPTDRKRGYTWKLFFICSLFIISNKRFYRDAFEKQISMFFCFWSTSESKLLTRDFSNTGCSSNLYFFFLQYRPSNSTTIEIGCFFVNSKRQLSYLIFGYSWLKIQVKIFSCELSFLGACFLSFMKQNPVTYLFT